DAVCFGDDMPAFDVRDLAAALVAFLDVFSRERSAQAIDNIFGEGGHAATFVAVIAKPGRPRRPRRTCRSAQARRNSSISSRASPHTKRAASTGSEIVTSWTVRKPMARPKLPPAVAVARSALLATV